jgi:serine protease AprX
MGKLIVIPNTEVKRPRRGLLSNAESDSMRDSVSMRDTAFNIHAGRRQRLHDFAAQALGGTPGPQPRSSQDRSDVRLQAQARRYRVLEGIGALLMDEEDVDVKHLEETLGAKVYENALIASVTPTGTGVATQSTQPDYWHLDKINVKALRDKELTGAGIIVGVLDSGIQSSHPEFAGKTIHFAQFDKNGNKIDIPAKDFGDHGTHVSGLIGGKNAGVAPDATLAVAAVLTEQRGQAGYLAAILAGLDWLIKTDFSGNQDEPGCHLVNSSLEVRPFNDFLYSSMAAAAAAPGSLMIAASGNNATAYPEQPSTPGNYDIVVGIGATDNNDQIAAFSEWGTVAEQGGIAKPDMCAPGVNIWSSVPTNRYQPMSGTSMACPIVSGAAALLLQQNPAFAGDVASLKEALLSSTLALPDQQQKSGRGRLLLGG